MASSPAIDLIARDLGLKHRRRPAARRSEIIEAATAEFVEKGFASARLDDVAARAGIRRATIYRYFADKEDVFRAVVIQTMTPHVEALKALGAQPDTSLADLLQSVVGPMAQIVTETRFGAVFKIEIGEGGNFPELARIWHDRLLSPVLEVLTQAVADAQARSEVRAGDPQAFAIQILSPMLATLVIRETFVSVGAPGFEVEPLLRQSAETFLAGCSAALRGAS